ncbi:MAG: D-alanyl-D-alanine carboxypeptidase family protein [Promicromonosporaceae bacterium]|nr:D-alanyl-D-alanine carboxypeptidase family protein [Promicromonosporaceae bacterium]
MHAVTTGLAAVAAAALTVTTVPTAPTTPHAHRATATPGPQAVTVSGTATLAGADEAVHATPATAPKVEAALSQAAGTLMEADHVTTEGARAQGDQVTKIQQATAVVRELVRRAAVTLPEPTPLASSTKTPAATGQLTPAATGQLTPAATAPTTDAPTESGDATSIAVVAGDKAAAPKAVTAAADAALTAAAKASKSTATEAAPETVAAALTQQTAALAKLITSTPAATVSVTPAPPSPEEIAAKKAAEEAAARAAAEKAAAEAAAKAAAQAAAERAQLQALADQAKQYGNGQIPASLLRAIPWSPGSMLRADAAIQLEHLNQAFRARFGSDIGITDSYRSYADQVAVKRARGFWAATPGTSNHGFGVAVDLGSGIASFGSETYRWMAENAGKFGFVNPAWAQPGAGKPEPWHWEYTG